MVSMKTEDGAAPNMVARLKREECSRTKHDKFFSKWEILIGPNDWEDHDSGKDGVERYRIHNLPSGSSCPGLYELGVTHTPTIGNHRLRKLDPEDVVVVYLGQADNVRTRLQEYGRSGSHLNDRNRIALTINYESSSQRERTALFRDVFSKGYSIVFRWTPVKSKNDAEKTEIDLLNVFDYAWNRRGNGSCRHAEILAKLKQKSSTAGHSPLRRLQRMNLSFGKKMGINIDESLPFLEEVSPPHGLKAFLLPRVLKFSGSQLQFLRDTDKSFVEVTCGVAIGHGAVCRRKPLPGRKRCAEHKGKKIIGTSSASSRLFTSSFGVLLEDGSPFNKGIPDSKPLLDELHSSLQQCQPEPNKETMKQHKSQKVVDAMPMPSAEKIYLTCGVMDDHGFICNRLPVPGRKRCAIHKGRRITDATPSFIAKKHSSKEEGRFPICGFVCGDSVCQRSPVSGRKRCELHKGRKVLHSTFAL